MAELLVELYSEPLPPWAQKEGSVQLARLLRESLEKRNFLEEGAKAFGYATTERLAVRVEGVLVLSEAQEIETRGPREGANEKALEGFLRKAGFSSTEDEGVELRETPKGKFWFATKVVPPQPVAVNLSEVITETIFAMRWKKSMRWDASGLRWPRPLRHGIIRFNRGQMSWSNPGAEIKTINKNSKEEDYSVHLGFLFASKGKKMGTKIGNEIVSVPSAGEWEEVLRENGVQFSVCGVESAEEIETTDAPAFFAERPCILKIHPESKGLPESFIPIILEHHLSTRKNPKGGYKYVASMPHGIEEGEREEFEWRQRAKKRVEKIAQSRLDDALFYWKRDKELGLEGLYERLGEITFHPKLGSVRLHAKRVSRLVPLIAKELRDFGPKELKCAQKAVLYAKADLASETVREIPELQGYVGSELYEVNENFSYYKDYPRAVYGKILDGFVYVEEYMDPLSTDLWLEFSVALASQLDFLIGFMAAGERATGTSDPYGLRACATKICHYLVYPNVSIDFNSLVKNAWDIYATHEKEERMPSNAPKFSSDKTSLEDVKEFMRVREEYHLKAYHKIPYDVTRAVMHNSSVYGEGTANFNKMGMDAIELNKLLQTSEGKSLLLAWRRAKGLINESDLEPKFFNEALSKYGRKLNLALQEAEKELQEDSTLFVILYLKILENLCNSVSDFLDAEKVLVGTEQEQQARLALLDRFIQVVKRVADLDYIEGGDITARKDSARLNQG